MEMLAARTPCGPTMPLNESQFAATGHTKEAMNGCLALLERK
jgi:hypothetical protein